MRSMHLPAELAQFHWAGPAIDPDHEALQLLLHRLVSAGMIIRAAEGTSACTAPDA